MNDDTYLQAVVNNNAVFNSVGTQVAKAANF